MRRTIIVVSGALLSATVAGAATMEELDANADGAVTFEELLAVMPDVTEEAFTAADTSADGLIDAEELAAAQDAAILPSE